MSSAPHPFPPVVRWAVFPALAALTGAGGGLAAAALGASEPPLRWAAIAGGLSLGAALGAVLSRRAWVALLAGPVVGLLVLCAVVATTRRLELGRAQSALDLLLHLLRESRALVTIGAGLWVQAAACHGALRPPLPPPWRRLLALYVPAAALAGLVAFACVDRPERGAVALLFILSTAPQAAVVRACLALAARLRSDNVY